MIDQSTHPFKQSTAANHLRWFLGLAAVLFGWSVALTLWADSVAGAQEVEVQQDPPHDQVLSHLRSARQFWRSFGDDSRNYTFTYTVSCSCPSSPEITVTVVNDEVGNVTTSDESTVPNPRTIESIFDEIEGHVDAPADRLSASFYSLYPNEFFVDPSLAIADDEYGVVVSSLTLERTRRVWQALDAAEQRWAATGADNYTLTFRERCFMCLPDLHSTVTVIGGQAVDAIDSLGRDAFWWAETVESMFERIRESDGLRLLTASFDETFGYPTSFNNGNPRIIDDYSGFSVMEYEPLVDVPIPDVDVEVRCINQDGRIDLLIDSNNPADGPIDYQITIGTVAPRTRSLVSGTIHREFASGRFDAIHGVSISVDDLTVWYREVTIECDPARVAEAEVETSCLANNGRVDVYLTNLDPDEFPDRYSVKIGSLSSRSVFLYPGDLPFRMTRTGRPDGPLTVVVKKDNVEIERVEVVIDCDIETDRVEVVTSCLQFNGRVDVTVHNDGSAQATYDISFTGLADRTRTVPAQQSETITYTGRPDRSFTVEVRKNGATIASETVTIGCDAEST